MPDQVHALGGGFGVGADLHGFKEWVGFGAHHESDGQFARSTRIGRSTCIGAGATGGQEKHESHAERDQNGTRACHTRTKRGEQRYHGVKLLTHEIGDR